MATKAPGPSLGPIDDSGTAPATTPERAFTVLVIDADPEVRESTTDVLMEHGYGVIEAADGVEGLRRFNNESVDVVLLDLEMPRLDGSVVLASLDDPPPVVIVSAFDSFNEDDVHRTFGPKVYACLRKPVPPERLVSVVTEATRGRQPQDWRY